MVVLQSQVRNDGTPIPDAIPIWVSNTSPINVSSFVDDALYQTEAQVAISILTAISGNTANLSGLVVAGSNISILNNNTGFITGNGVVFYSNVYTILSPVYDNIATVSNTVSILSSNVASLSSNVVSQVAILTGNVNSLGSLLTSLSSNVAFIGNNVSIFTNNMGYQNVSQVSTTVSNALSNVVYYGNISNIHLSSFYNDLSVSNVSLANVLYYSNLNTIDVRKLSNTSNIVYLGSNVSALSNDSGYLTNNTSPVFNNITINGTANTQILNASTEITTPIIYTQNADVSNEIVLGQYPNCIILTGVAGRTGTGGLQIAQDALGLASLIFDGAGIAMSLADGIKSLFGADGTPSEEISDDLSESITVQWNSIYSNPLPYTGTLSTSVGASGSLYLGGSIKACSGYSTNPATGSTICDFISDKTVLDVQNGILYADVQSSNATTQNLYVNDIYTKSAGYPTYIFTDLNSQGNLTTTQTISASRDISSSANLLGIWMKSTFVQSANVATNYLTANSITIAGGGGFGSLTTSNLYSTSGTVGNLSTNNINSDIKLYGNVVSYRNVSMYASVLANSLTVLADTNFYGNINSLTNVTMTGNLQTSGNIAASNYFINSSNIQQYILNTVGNNYWVGNTNSISTTANASVSGNLYVAGGITTPNLAVNNLKASGNGTIYCYSNVVFVNSSLTLDPSDLIVELDAVVWGNLAVLTDVVVSNDVFAQNIYSFGNLIVSSQFTGNASNVSTRANVNIVGNLSVSNNIYIANTSLQNYIIQTVGNVNISYSNITSTTSYATNIYSNVINTTNIYSSNIVSNSISTNTITIGGNTINQYIFNTISNVINTTILYSSNISSNSLTVGNATVSGTLFLNNITIAGNTLSQYITNITGNTSLLVSNVYLQTNYVNNAYIQNTFATASSLTAFVGNNISYASNAYIQNQYVSKTQGNAWYLSGTGYISNNTSYNASVGSLNATAVSVSGNLSAAALSVSGTNISSIYQPIGSYLTSVPTGFSVSSATFTSSINLPYASTFNGKTSSLNNDVPFLTSVSSTAIPGINSTGTVGINTSSPGITLDVNGKWGSTSTIGVAVPSVGTNGGSGDKMIMYPGTGTTHPYSLGINGATLWYSVPTGAIHNWYVAGTSYMSLSSTGLSFSPVINSWITSSDGKYRVYYASLGRTYHASGDGTHEWRIDAYGATTGMFLNSTGLSIGSGTSSSYPLNVYSGGTGSQTMVSILSPMSTGNNTDIAIGTAVSTNNCGYINFANTGGTGSSSNNLGIGIWGAAAYSQQTTTGWYVSGILTATGNTNLGSGAMTVTSGTEVDVFKPLYCHSLATVNTTTTLNNSVLTVAGNIYTTAIQVGNYSTSSLQGASLNTGIVQIANSGNMLGPHLATYTNVDNYPIFQNLSWQHDNAAIGWDCYYDGTTFRTSSSTTGYQIYKLSGQLRFNNCNSSGAGNTTTAYTDLCIGIGTVFVCATTSPSGASNAFEVNGNMYASGAIYGTGGGISVAIGNPICYINTSGVFTSTAFGSTYANYMFIGGRARFTQCDIFSDKSLKKNVRERDGAKDLELLMKVPMKEYEYIDKREHPDDNHVGVIAQEVEKIPELKHLVKHHKGYIPDYFNTVDIVEINDETFTIIGGVHYPDDTRIRFFYEKDGVEETAHGIIKDGNISHKHERLNCSRIFLYGREIQDVKSVNYNHIHNLTTSSVQELYRIMQALADTVSSQQKQIDTLKKYLTYSK